MEEKIENNSEENMRNLEEFIAHIAKQDEPSSEWKPLIKALWWVRKGDWDKAHDLAQEVDGPDGSWVHAYLHREEGDIGNAGYWYRRAGRPVKTTDSLEYEWIEISRELLNN